MPVTARRTSLSRAVTQLSSTDRPTGRTLAKHRRPSKSSSAPRAAAAVLSVGLAVGGGAALSLSTTPATASAATMTAAQARGHRRGNTAQSMGCPGAIVGFSIVIAAWPSRGA